MEIAVLAFPGTNGDRDVLRALELVGLTGRIVWHKEYKAGVYDAVIVAGGFSYGDRLRAGAIAARTKAAEELREDAERGTPILGICNGFQILVEAGVLPGALLPNDPPRFVSRDVLVRVVDVKTPFTLLYEEGETIRLPVAHGEGRYVYEERPRAVVKYVEDINGSMDLIAGISSGNVVGMMPHPERAVDRHVSSGDGARVWLSLKLWLRT
ncbi:phosphoribosylformylglycinamidine synthase I [Thermoproteus tenax]|uniref:Phosphoribosylformylglycinamidine synthase subunit PurQ n=1 Tax=Thermoproteus tenax (strain ATCC 35583 / DSM 2078 / JCM 9277 / NBRC 100435 / Kra 1) TaxID=768679 RepID=G4RLY1_THETK|nr:phosphoribosylformylglycinamidine synthase I [Thermoproteus tenax]CCC82576.1 phosphoribosylformylglycinamidine synthase I [Thermoproteus tenax Kra 1]